MTRIRRRDAETSYFDLSSVWTFAAVLVLPGAYAAVACHDYPVVWVTAAPLATRRAVVGDALVALSRKFDRIDLDRMPVLAADPPVHAPHQIAPTLRR